jgi:hypothetical protein
MYLDPAPADQLGMLFAPLARIIQRGAIRPHDDTGGGMVFCGVEDAGIGV